MGLFDGMFDGGAGKDLQKGYDQANGYMDPFYQGGKNSFNQWQQSTNQMGHDLSQYGNPAAYQWSQINQSPMSYYQNIMGSYQESPEAKYNQEQAMRGGNAAASASGMMGSGAYANGMQENANRISQGDRQQYYGNVMGANQAQMQSLQNFQGRQDQYNNMLQGQSQMGYGAGSQMSQNAMQHAQMQAQNDQYRNNNMWGAAGMAAKFLY